MTNAYIVNGIRTPIGRYGGSLSQVRPDDLGAHAIRELMKKNPSVPAGAIDDIIFGCANQAGEDNRNVARMSGLLAGLPVEIPGVTVNRLCGSGLDAVGQAARAIKAGEANLVVAGGVESMSRAPFVMGKATEAFSRTQNELFDTTIGWRFVNPAMKKQYGVDAMTETAENVAKDFQVTREDQDKFALVSQTRASSAQKNGRFAKEIAPVTIPQRRGDPIIVERDEHPRETTLDKLAKLPTLFKLDGATVTPGNASGVNDGAAALLIASEAAVEKYGLEPIARVLAATTAGVPPRVMGIGPVPASLKLAEMLGHQDHRFRRDRAQRGLRRPGSRRPAPTRPARRRRSRQPEWRRNRARSSARHVRCPPRPYRRARVAAAKRPARPLHHVHRRRPRHRAGDRAGVTAKKIGTTRTKKGRTT